jgi:membrane-bound ClpP family serine protease
VNNEGELTKLEGKFQSVGIQFRWWGIVVFIVGVIMAILEFSGGSVIAALGFVVALQGAIIQYVFRQRKT